MAYRNSPSYSPTTPEYQPMEEYEGGDTSRSGSSSPILWEAPSSPGGWSDSTIPWPLDLSDRDGDFEDGELPTSPWPRQDSSEDMQVDVELFYGVTLPREDEEDSTEEEVMPSPLEYVGWSDSTYYVSDPEE